MACNASVLRALAKANGKPHQEYASDIEKRTKVLYSAAKLYQQLAESAERDLSRKAEPLFEEERENEQDNDSGLVNLRETLKKLERLPENEGERFKLESENLSARMWRRPRRMA